MLTPSKFVTFQRFLLKEQAMHVAQALKEEHIDFMLTQQANALESPFVPNQLPKAYVLKLRAMDFPRANQLLERLAQRQLLELPSDYYLFSFSDQELLDILHKPDEWGKLDYVLAQHLLRERGHVLPAEEVEDLKTERMLQLSTPARHPLRWVLIGYALALLGGLGGLVTGLSIAKQKSILPDGEVIYRYSRRNRRHGWAIVVLSCLVLLASVSYLLLREVEQVTQAPILP